MILWVGEHTHLVNVSSTDIKIGFAFSEHVPDAVLIPSCAREVLPRFDWHHLNRPVAMAALTYRPNAILIKGLYGCTLDLPRVASLLGLTVCLELIEPVNVEKLSVSAMEGLRASLRYVDLLAGEHVETLRSIMPDLTMPQVGTQEEAVEALSALPVHARLLNLGYARYEFCMRDHVLLCEMQRQYVDHFAGCNQVLDLACGAGIFIQLLAENGIQARGVERDPDIAEYARGMGLRVETKDALEFLRCQPDGSFDGIYCSHFVEHLPFNALEELMRLLKQALRPGGVLVMVFPDPESIRSQLLGFWRDPEHVRFYHPELIELLGVSMGLTCEWTSCHDQPHVIVSFPDIAWRDCESSSFLDVSASPADSHRYAWWSRVIGKLGLGPDSASSRNRAELALLRQRCDELATALHSQGQTLVRARQQIDNLWQINQTWAWQDNAAMRFRKPFTG